MNRHVVVHQFDPTRHVAGGIDGYIRDLVVHSGAEHQFSILGVERESTFLGRWRTVSIGGRSVDFMPLTRLEAGNQMRRVPHSLRLATGLARYRPEVGDAILHSHRAEVGALVSCIYRDTRRTQFIHGDASNAFRWRQETVWRFAPWIYDVIERFAVRRATRTLIMSRSGLARLRRHSATAMLGENWFDGQHFDCRDRERSSPGVIGWAGRLEPPKDPLTAIRVFGELRNRGVPFQAWIAGGGTLEPDVREAVLRAGLHETVRVLGVLAPDELAAELRRTDVFLMTSLWEGIPRTVIEALACGVPVASTDAGDVKAYVTDGRTGFVSRTRTTEDLAGTVVQAFALEPGCEIAKTVSHLEVRRVVPDLLAQLTQDTRR